MGKILGIDLGTNSLGLALRNEDSGKNLKDQLEWFSSVIFKTGVGRGKTGEYSYAAERTKKRSPRRLYQARKYRIWATLELLIEKECCPLTIEQLDKWRRYDKQKGFKREYPVDATEFEQWVRLDFDNDGKPEYSSPYELRAELMERQIDMSDQTDRYKFGRAMYHIAQRRGFKSSKGETLKELNNNADDMDMSEELKKSEQKKSKLLTEYMEGNGLKTVGCALYKLEQDGVRVRGSEYQAVRSQYIEEIKAIFAFQERLRDDKDFLNRLTSSKKGEGTIFYKRPLRSQKGLVGRCVLEPDKPRCPISHPDFETFRAWQLINNIKYRESAETNEWKSLEIDLRKKVYDKLFVGRKKSHFKFSDITELLTKELGIKLTSGDKKHSYKDKTINYRSDAMVAGCPISSRLKDILGDGWQAKVVTSEEKRNGKNKTYNYIDLWHIAFSSDEAEDVIEIAQKIGLDESQTKQLVKLQANIMQGYSTLSLKAIKNINRFLLKGFIYSHAVFLAKMPELFGDSWIKYEKDIELNIAYLMSQNKKEKQVAQIANKLIARYRMQTAEDKHAFRNPNYKLDDADFRDIENAIEGDLGKDKWQRLSEKECNEIFNAVATAYQKFFADGKYISSPRLSDCIREFVSDNFGEQEGNSIDFEKLYHPSMIEVYAPAKEYEFTIDDAVIRHKLLGSPRIGAIRNPMAMRALFVLRSQINALIKKGFINEDTRIVVETARELNDANMRWAIEQYNKARQNENDEYAKILADYYPNRKINDVDIERVRLLMDQCEINQDVLMTPKESKAVWELRKDVKRYRAWLEQGGFCLYTGKPINIKNLFDENVWDFEHTVPRSKSFDNSMSNLTICDANYNRNKKKNKLPSECQNYDEILQRLGTWQKHVESLRNSIMLYKQKSKFATAKESKDYYIRQRHLDELELDYWEKKLRGFTITPDKINDNFRNSQLVDTRIITKYAFHFLKTVFERVDVEKGNVTADFRKILGVQSVEEKKSRARHSHHAIDATMLTLMPSAALRDEMIKLFYEKEEAEHLHEDAKALKKEEKLKERIKQCGVGVVAGIGEYIDSQILINHVSKDQTLTPASKRIRVRGKIVYVTKDGKKVEKKMRGDCIRGQLHKDTFFGAIKYPKLDNEEKPVVNEQGRYVYEKDVEGNEIITMVGRVPITSFTKVKELDKIVDKKLRDHIKAVVEKRMKEENGNGKLKSFAEAMSEPIWMVGENGQEVKVDKIGKRITPLRHIRCKIAAGRGYFTKDKAIQVKEQAYKSKKNYKNFYYAQNDGNYLCLLYNGIKNGKVDRKFKLLSYFEVARMKLVNINDLYAEPYFKEFEERGVVYELAAILRVGTKVLLWKNSPEELPDLSLTELSKRLFVVYKFNFKGANCIYLRNHIEARNEISSDEDYTNFDNNKYQALLTLVANGFNCLIEGRDFEIDELGNVKFKN